MDKLTYLKTKVINAYVKLYNNLQRGYMLENYSDIVDAMYYIDFISIRDLDRKTETKILDIFISKL